MKSQLMERLEKIETELQIQLVKGNIYKVQALQAEKSQLCKLLKELT